MYLSRIRIENFRNFKALDVELAGNIVVVGENKDLDEPSLGSTSIIFAITTSVYMTADWIDVLPVGLEIGDHWMLGQAIHLELSMAV